MEIQKKEKLCLQVKPCLKLLKSNYLLQFELLLNVELQQLDDKSETLPKMQLRLFLWMYMSQTFCVKA